nr:peptidoglycan-associated lipoprotein Pal [Paracidobacterium acidisoli]
MLTVAGCHKKPAPPPPPPPTPAAAPAPTAAITATPDTINAGGSVVLTWHTSDATDVSIEGLGQVAANGTQTVNPANSTSYHLVARGDGGSADATANVTVNSAPVQNNIAESNIDEAAFEQSVKPVFYDYDSYDIRADAQTTIQADANFLNQHPDLKVVVGGYCDERGSTEYNLALGENRANAAKQALVSAGVSPDRLRTVSYGKEKQFCTDHSESCWQLNRRGQFTLDR